MKELSERARTMLDAQNAVDSPPAHVQVSVWESIASRMAAGDMGLQLGPEPSLTKLVGVTTGNKVAWIALGTIVAVGIATSVAIGLFDEDPVAETVTVEANDTASAISSPPAPRPVPPVEKPTAAVGTDPTTDMRPKPEDIHGTSRRTPNKSAVPAKVDQEPTLEQEIMLMTEARAALGSGDAARAIRLFERHAKIFPHGEFAMEREVSWITALCVLARTSMAQDRAQKFLPRYPNSPHAAKVRASCGGQTARGP